tara:strand:- start:320 stop:496 length:177 start_codon:yes stop_codon:yes gene_type:complete
MAKNRNDRRAERHANAEVRKEISDKLSPEARLENLDRRFGKGQGAQRERTKLEKLISK